MKQLRLHQIPVLQALALALQKRVLVHLIPPVVHRSLLRRRRRRRRRRER